MKEALLYEQFQDNSVRCRLCSHFCRIAQGERGICRVRRNVDGMLYSASYGRLIAAACDPIEKKPLYHFLPGTSAYSVATAGCNFRCGFCQNWQISQDHSGQRDPGTVAPDEIVGAAIGAGCRSIAYTYTEPTIFFEYAFDITREARAAGLANVFVTNGYMSADSLKMIRPYLDAANVDIKSFRDEFYTEYCGARLQPVLDSVELMKDMGIWVEITTLVIPGENDSEAELDNIARFIASLDANIPWHVSRFYPQYKFQQYEATPVDALTKAKEAGVRRGLKFIYLGNTGGGADTFCPACGKNVISRLGFSVSGQNIRGGRCGSCGEKIAGYWE